jgi:hypothetical protein
MNASKGLTPLRDADPWLRKDDWQRVLWPLIGLYKRLFINRIDRHTLASRHRTGSPSLSLSSDFAGRTRLRLLQTGDVSLLLVDSI